MRRTVGTIGVVVAVSLSAALGGCGSKPSPKLAFGEATQSQWGACGRAFAIVKVPALANRASTAPAPVRAILAIRGSSVFETFSRDVTIAAASAATRSRAETAQAWKHASAACIQVVRAAGVGP